MCNMYGKGRDKKIYGLKKVNRVFPKCKLEYKNFFLIYEKYVQCLCKT